MLLLSVFLGAQRLDLGRLFTAQLDAPVGEELWLTGAVSGSPGIMMPEVSLANRPPASDIMTPKSNFANTMTAMVKSEDADETPPVEAMTVSTSELALAAGASIDDSEILSARPILWKNPQSGKLEIGNFKSLSLVGSSDDCLDFGHSLLSDAGSSNSKLDVMISADEITIARICAVNGSVVISCRGGQISVSPRKARPDDNCTEKG